MEHSQSVVKRAYAFVEDMFGLRHESPTPHEPEDPDAYPYKTVEQLSEEMRGRQDGE